MRHLKDKGVGHVAISWKVLTFMRSMHIAMTRDWERICVNCGANCLICDNFTENQRVMLSTPPYKI